MNVQIRGYAVRWGDPYGNYYPEDQLAYLVPGALQMASDVRLHADHDRSLSFAGTRDGSLTVFEDGNGLGIEAEVSTDTVAGTMLVDSIANGSRNGMSLGFYQLSSTDGDGYEIIESAQLCEVSVVHEGHCHSARCWLADREDNLPIGLGHLCADWHNGSAQRSYLYSPLRRPPTSSGGNARRGTGALPSFDPVPQLSRSDLQGVRAAYGWRRPPPRALAMLPPGTLARIRAGRYIGT